MINEETDEICQPCRLQGSNKKQKNVCDYKGFRLGDYRKKILKVNYFNSQKGHSNEMSRGV